MKYSQKLQPGWVRFSRRVRMSSSKRPRFLVKDMRRSVRNLSSREFQDSWDRDESFRGSDRTTHLQKRDKKIIRHFLWIRCKLNLKQPLYRGLLWPVILFVTEIAANLVHDGRSRQDVGLILLLVIVALHDNDDPVCWAMRPQAVLPSHHVLLDHAFICFCVLWWNKIQISLCGPKMHS